MPDVTGPWDDDDTLLAALGDVLRADPPAEVIEAAKDLFTWRTVDAELAELTYDSLLDAAPAAVRAIDQPRILTFEADGLAIDVEVDAGPTGRRLVGQLVPAQVVELELLGQDSAVSAVSDALGRFVVALPGARSRLGLRIRLADGRTVGSNWLML